MIPDRLIDEALFQLEAVDSTTGLRTLLSSAPVFTRVFKFNESATLRLWKTIQDAGHTPESYLDPELDRLRNGNSSLLGTTLFDQCYFYQMRGNWDKAIELARELVGLSEQLADEERNMNITRALGLWLLQRGEYEESAQLLRHSRVVANSPGDLIAEGGAICNLGLIDYLQGNALEAMGYFTAALEKFRAVNFRRWELFALGNLSHCLVSLRRHDEARVNFQQVLDLSRALQDQFSVVRTTGALGYVHLALKQHEEAMRYSVDSAKLAEELHLEYDAACAYDCVAMIHSELGQFETAITYFDRAEEIFARHHNKRDLAIVHTFRAYIRWETGDHVTALSQYLQAIREGQDVQSADQVAMAQNGIASALIELRDIERSQSLWSEVKAAQDDLPQDWAEAARQFVAGSRTTYEKATNTPMLEECDRLEILLRSAHSHPDTVVNELRALAARQKVDSQRAHTLYWIWKLSQDILDAERAIQTIMASKEYTALYVFRKYLRELQNGSDDVRTPLPHVEL